MPGPCRSLVERWREVAHALPDRPALHSSRSHFTFAEADRLSDILAAGLMAELQDDDPEVPVALCVGHDAVGLIGVLAVMKIGRILVVLDPHLPAPRLRVISEAAGATACVADAGSWALAEELGAPLTRVLRLEQLMSGDAPEGTALEALVDVGQLRSGQDPAAVVFTSGSTGRPKGVIQTHDVTLNDAYANRLGFGFTPQDRITLVLPYGFAAGYYLIFIALLNGVGLWCFDPRDGGTRGLIKWIDQNQLDVLVCSPHLARSVADALGPDQRLNSLRILATVGEAVHGRDVELFRSHLRPECSFFNWTGSSEMGTLAIFEITGDAAIPSGTVPAGHFVANKDAHLQGENGGPVAAGEPGELIAASDYLSGGYWRDEAGTAARFDIGPDGRRRCHQGDLARFDENGNLVLLGRADAAVKVRGYLVEPSEIEAACLSADGVKEVVVVTVANPPAPTALIAYVVPDPSLRTASTAALRRHLRQLLPEYMIPTDIVLLSELPRNERGKVDRPNLPRVDHRERSRPPVNHREIVMADLWADILGLDFIGADDDFMALGGDSLSAEEMLAVVRERLGVSLASTDLIEAPTLSEFTRRVAQGTASLPSHPDVVTLQAKGSLDPLFCFAGSGALALTFLPLSRHFPDRPVYAFQAHGLERRAIPDWSVEAAARRYLKIVRIIQPRGPYLFVGHSFGGLIALETARLLTDAEEQVGFVALLDTYLPRNVGKVPTLTFEPLPDRPIESTAWQTTKRLAHRQFRRVLPDGLPALRQWNRQARGYLAGIVPFSGQRQFDAFFDHGAVTGRHYKIYPYGGRALVILADNNPDGPQPWAAILTGPHSFVNIPTEHSSLLREPHATVLATALKEAMSGFDESIPAATSGSIPAATSGRGGATPSGRPVPATPY